MSQFIDLNAGKDFLTMDAKPGVVVLHFIFRGGFGMDPTEAPAHAALSLSPVSSWSNWRRKLVESKARFIFAYGGMAEVGGTYLVNLDGYKVAYRRDDNQPVGEQRVNQNAGLWIFERL